MLKLPDTPITSDLLKCYNLKTSDTNIDNEIQLFGCTKLITASSKYIIHEFNLFQWIMLVI